MIKFSFKAKKTILDDRAALEAIISMVEPVNLHTMPEKLEICIYQFLTQLVREETENKRIVGELIFVPVFQKRISGIL